MKDLNSDGKPLVCFFDSGIGGLTLLSETVKRTNGLRFLYFADNYRVPYGRFTCDELIDISDGIFGEIAKHSPAAAVIACNTVTAHCAAYLRGKYKFPIVGIQPAVKPAAQGVARCLVLATAATAQSRVLCDLVARYGNGVTQIAACPELASYIENNVLNLDENKIFELLPKVKADSVVLGCTHYIYVKDIISKFYGNCHVFDGVDGTVKRLFSILGIYDHFSGDFCPQTPKKQGESGRQWTEVGFIGGNTSKNALVLKSLFFT